MNTPTGLPSDLIDLLGEFENLRVEYLLVGGQAVALHGLPRFTKYADLWVRDTSQNLGAVAEALRRFGAPAAVVSALDSAAPLDVLWMGNPPARIDLMKGVPGGEFKRAWDSRDTRSVAGVQVHVVGLEELVRLKKASGRPQDLLDAANLEKLSG